TIGTVMNRGHNKKTIHTVFGAHHMHEDRRNDGARMSTTQHSVGESQQQQQRGAHGGLLHAYRSLRSRTRVAPPSPHTLCKNSVQQRPHAGNPNHTRHNSDASR
ncbi:hypothetical protein TcG_12984, partial [Trypanosoma cruzi]